MESVNSYSSNKNFIHKFFREKIYKKIIRIIEFIKFVIRIKTSRNPTGLFFFFPFYHVGGAERVHIDILKTIADKNPWIFFTNQSDNNAFYNEFKQQGKIFDISFFVNKFKFLTKYIIAHKINKSKNVICFGCNSYFFYQLIPQLNKEIECIDLIHAFAHKNEKAAEDWSLPYINRLNKRIFISKNSIQKLQNQYLENGIPNHFLNNIEYIPNQTFIPIVYPEKRKKERINIIYVGRGSKEKRVNIIGRIAKMCFDMKLPIDFIMVGNNKFAIEPENHKYLQFVGEVTDFSIMENIYKKADIILITSSREGFPMVVMEAMSYGCIPISTEVGDINIHISNGTNGFVIPDYPNEEVIIEKFVYCIEKICKSEFNSTEISHNAYEYAKRNFSSDSFYQKYRSLLLRKSE